MKAVCIHRRSDPPQLVVDDVSSPSPGAGDVLIRVRAAAVTPTELVWVPTWTTAAGAPRPFPIIPGHELSGEIVALGAGVTDLAPGDAVYGLNDWFADGTQAEYCVARATDVAPKPRSIDHVHAAATPISALTAWQGLVVRGGLQAGARVLIHGAGGGVGLFAVQIARSRGAHVIATTSARTMDVVRSLGAAEVLDHRATRFEEVVRDVDLVFDGAGGETLARSWDVVRPGGRVVTIAASSEHTTDPRIRDAFFIVEPNRAQLADVAQAIDAGSLRVLVGGVFPLAEVQAAYAHRPPHGKAVLDVPS